MYTKGPDDSELWENYYQELEERGKPDFGDYVLIEQRRYGTENEMYQHKVIGRFRSNSWVDTPVQSPATETLHDECVDVLACICCGVWEREVLQNRESDVFPLKLKKSE